MSIRIVLADDHGILLDGIRSSLEKVPEMEVVATVRDGLEAIRTAREQRADLVVMDVSMPGMNGIEATRRITDELPDVKVLCLSMHVNTKFVRAALRAGAVGYLIKERAMEDLVEAVQTVMAKGVYLCPEIVTGIAQDYKTAVSGVAHSAPSQLTSKEREVLQLIAEGYSSKCIAGRLHVSMKTVSTHRQHIMDKLHIHNIPGLTRYAIEEGIILIDAED